MTNINRKEDKERVLRYLLRKGDLCNTYKVARELEMDRLEVLEVLNELAKEDKVRLKSGSVRATTLKLSEEEKLKTKSEVEELKDRVKKLERVLEVTFNQIKEAVQTGYQQMPREEYQLKEDQLREEDQF